MNQIQIIHLEDLKILKKLKVKINKKNKIKIKLKLKIIYN